MATCDYDPVASDSSRPADRPAWITDNLIDLTLGLTDGTESEAIGLIVAFWQVLVVVWQEPMDEAVYRNRTSE
jgi:hypothetical protein